MRLAKVRVRNFRSVEDETISLGDLAVLVGPNSCGKSNVFRAIMFPLQERIGRQEIYDNLSSWRRDTQGAPLLSIWIDLFLSDSGVEDLFSALVPGQSLQGNEIHIAFRAIRSGTVSYRCSGNELDTGAVARLKELIQPVFIPSIRDLDHGGLEPFQQVLADALGRARGQTIALKQQEVRNILTNRAGGLLAEAERELKRHLPGLRLLPDADAVSLEDVYKLVHLSTEDGATGRLSVSTLGTGHQSVLIMALHKALADSDAALTLFLIDEPASHLHPTALQVLLDELNGLSESAQVLVATHSPGLVNRIGLRRCVRVDKNQEGRTHCQNLSDRLSSSEKHVAHVLFHHQMRALEPLFSRDVILVEGPFDATALRRTAELLGLGMPEDKNVPVVAAGGKGAMPRLIALLNECGTARILVLLDEDARYGGATPVVKQRQRPDAEKSQLIAAAQLLAGELDLNKRAEGIRKSLAALEDELASAVPEQTVYDGSSLAEIIGALGSLRVAQKEELRRELQRGRIRRPKELMKQSGVFLLKGSADSALLTMDGAEDIVAGELGRNLAGQSLRDAKRRAASWLKSLANEPTALSQILEALHNAGLLARSNFGRTVRSIMGSLSP